MLNAVQLIGHLSIDPDFDAFSTSRHTISARLSVQPNPRLTDRLDPLTIAGEGHIGEEVLEYMTKGALVVVEGRLRTRNKQMEVLVESVYPVKTTLV